MAMMAMMVAGVAAACDTPGVDTEPEPEQPGDWTCERALHSAAVLWTSSANNQEFGDWGACVYEPGYGLYCSPVLRCRYVDDVLRCDDLDCNTYRLARPFDPDSPPPCQDRPDGEPDWQTTYTMPIQDCSPGDWAWCWYYEKGRPGAGVYCEPCNARRYACQTYYIATPFIPD